MKKTIAQVMQEDLERDLKKYYEMNELEKAQYRRKLTLDIEAADQASAEIHTEKLILRCRGLDD